MMYNRYIPDAAGVYHPTRVGRGAAGGCARSASGACVRAACSPASAASCPALYGGAWRISVAAAAAQH